MDFEQYGSQLILNHESKERTRLRICAGGEKKKSVPERNTNLGHVALGVRKLTAAVCLLSLLLSSFIDFQLVLFSCDSFGCSGVILPTNSSV